MRNTRFCLVLFFVFSFSLIISNFACTQSVLIPFGSQWKYLDDGSDQGQAWRNFSFDDNNWKSGKAPLGYESSKVVTTVNYGPDPDSKFITTYFRKKFRLNNPSGYLGFTLKLKYDDGGVVFVNGKEVVRINMRDGEILYKTRADGGSGEDKFFVAIDNFLDGDNIIAVEIHQSSPRSSDIIFDFVLSRATKLPDLMRKAPYLIYRGIGSEMKVYWQLTITAKCLIEWGTDSSFSLGQKQTAEFNDDHQHSFTLDKLNPGSKYFYRVSINSEIYTGNFYSAPVESESDLKFMVYGDTRTNPKDHDRVAQAMVSTYAEDTNYQTLVLAAGDLVGNGDREGHWDRQFFSSEYRNIQKLHGETPFISCMGNHERSGILFQKYFPYPFVADRYWSFDYGPAFFVIYDQFVKGENSIKKEIAWLETELKNSSKKWKIIILHEPGWTAGSHENDEGVQQFIQPLCEKYNVTAVFGGHNHYYARAVVNDVHHITTGGGGAPLYDPEPGHPNVVAYAKENHFCKITIKGSEFHFSAVTPEGKIIDEFTIGDK